MIQLQWQKNQHKRGLPKLVGPKEDVQHIWSWAKCTLVRIPGCQPTCMESNHGLCQLSTKWPAGTEAGTRSLYGCGPEKRRNTTTDVTQRHTFATSGYGHTISEPQNRQGRKRLPISSSPTLHLPPVFPHWTISFSTADDMDGIHCKNRWFSIVSLYCCGISNSVLPVVGGESLLFFFLIKAFFWLSS